MNKKMRKILLLLALLITIGIVVMGIINISCERETLEEAVARSNRHFDKVNREIKEELEKRKGKIENVTP